MVDASWLREAAPDFDSTNNWHTITATADAVIGVAGADCLIRLANVKVIWVAAVVGNEVFSADCKHRR